MSLPAIGLAQPGDPPAQGQQTAHLRSLESQEVGGIQCSVEGGTWGVSLSRGQKAWQCHRQGMSLHSVNARQLLPCRKTNREKTIPHIQDEYDPL